LAARKLFSKTDYENLTASDSTPASPELISSQETICSSQEAIKTKHTINSPVNQTVSSPTCSQDMFNNTDQPQSDVISSCVISSTPISTHERHKCDRSAIVATEQNSVTDALVCSKNSDTSYHKPDSEVHTTPSSTGNSPDCKLDTTDKICNPDTSYHLNFHDNSDLVDELFANHMLNLTQAATEQLLKQEKEKMTHSKLTVNNTDGGCGDDVIHNDVMHHVINKDKKFSIVTPINTANGFCHSKLSSSTGNGSIKKSTKPFKAPRLAKEVSKEEQNKLLEQYSKKFPSLVMNDRTPANDHDAENNNVVTSSSKLISCAFTSAGSGKKLTVSATSLQRAARLVEDFSADMITEEYGAINNNNFTDCVSEDRFHVEEPKVNEVIKEMPSTSTTTVREVSKENSPSHLVEKEAKESLEFGKEERSQEMVENCSLENIDMEQFGVFTQMPVYIKATDEITEENYHLRSTASVNEIPDVTWTPQPSITPLHKEPASSYITPGGSFNPCSPPARDVYNSDTSCQQPVSGQDDDEFKKMFSTQVVKQFLDFNSSNDDDDTVTTIVEVTDQLHSQKSTAASPTHCNENLHCSKSCDTDSHTHNKSPTFNDVPENNRSCDTSDHAYGRSCDDINSPTHTDPALSIPADGIVFGLSTASGKSVTVSNDAISSVKKLLDDKYEDRNKVTKTFSGFCTAKGDVVSVSTQSLKAVKHLFNDDCLVHNSDDIVATGNHNSLPTVTMATVTTQDEGTGIDVISFNDPATVTMTTDVLSLDKSCNPTPDTTVTMETTPANITNVSAQQ